MAATNTHTRFDVDRITRAASRQKLAVTVLSGGPSGERDISLQSGRCVAAALESLGHNVYVEDIGPDNLAALARAVDCVFVALHGAFGEDGQVQEILERRHIAYTGSPPAACALAMDKAAAKEKFQSIGVPTPRFSVARAENFREALAAWSLPVVVKPVKEGSSLHCYIVREYEQLRPAAQRVIDAYGSALIEEFVPGLEVTVGVLGDRTLPPIEIRTRREFYDFNAKYVDDDTEYRFEIGLPASLLEQIAEQSLAAHNALGCRDSSRLDWRVDPSAGRAYLLEANVVPGLTTHSLVPKAAAHVGIDMPQLCQFLVDAAIKRRFAKSPERKAPERNTAGDG